jgi:hypothetical protein
LTIVESRLFREEVNMVRTHFKSPLLEKWHANTAWERYQKECTSVDNLPLIARPEEDRFQARVAALRQILGPGSTHVRLGLANYLATVNHPRAAQTLAELVLFSSEPEVRQAAIKGLAGRNGKDYTAALMKGLRHLWPDAAQHSAEALVELKRKDLVNELAALLDQPDPRLPVVRSTATGEVHMVRELVRLNHKHNCLMCHAPGNTPDVSANAVTGEVPTPGEQPDPDFEYSPQPRPDLLVRSDVTYLRQDFSCFMEVKNPGTWPKQQRFDFIVRTREVSDSERKEWQDLIGQIDRSRPSPYQRATLFALRQLTGLDAPPTTGAWREVLKTARQD